MFRKSGKPDNKQDNQQVQAIVASTSRIPPDVWRLILPLLDQRARERLSKLSKAFSSLVTNWYSSEEKSKKLPIDALGYAMIKLLAKYYVSAKSESEKLRNALSKSTYEAQMKTFTELKRDIRDIRILKLGVDFMGYQHLPNKLVPIGAMTIPLLKGVAEDYCTFPFPFSVCEGRKSNMFQYGAAVVVGNPNSHPTVNDFLRLLFRLQNEYNFAVKNKDQAYKQVIGDCIILQLNVMPAETLQLCQSALQEGVQAAKKAMAGKPSLVHQDLLDVLIQMDTNIRMEKQMRQTAEQAVERQTPKP